MSGYIVDASIVVQRLIHEPQTPYTKEMFKRVDDGKVLL
jgi:predicted nucleic acid-binding protein